MSINNIPARELSNITTLYKNLPFPNGKRSGAVINMPVMVTWKIEVNNQDNDDTIAVKESFASDEEEIKRRSLTYNIVTTEINRINTDLEKLLKEITSLSSKYRVAKSDLWQYLSTL